MKRLLPIFIAIANYASGQDLHAVVKDSAGLKPIANAKIIAKGFDVYSDEKGAFTLKDFNQVGKRFSVRTNTYKTVEVLITDKQIDTLVVILHANPKRLRETEVLSKKH